MADSVHGMVPSEAGALHHEHQARGGAGPGTKYTTQLSFSGPSWGAVNTIYLPPLPMVISDAWIELDIAALGGPTTPSLVQAQTWAQNINLLYRRQTIYSQSEPEAVLDSYFNNKNQCDLVKRLDLQNDVAVATRRTNATGAWVYCISLRRIVDAIMSKVGPINSYAAQSWSIDLNLMALNRNGEGATSTAVTGGGINTMKLVLVGHKESPANTLAVSQALANQGVQVKFEQSQYRRFSYAASAASATISLPELQGEMTGLAILQRVVAGYDSTTPDTLNKLNWQVFEAVGDTIAIGTQADPQALFGQALPQRILRLASPSDSFSGSAKFIDADGSQRNTSIIFIPMEEAGTLGQREGVFSGVLRVQNDLQISMAFSTTTTANYVDVVVYLRRNVVFNEAGFGVINEE
jgi:hypothetical protein